jgi:hypothetical protein
LSECWKWRGTISMPGEEIPGCSCWQKWEPDTSAAGRHMEHSRNLPVAFAGTGV